MLYCQAQKQLLPPSCYSSEAGNLLNTSHSPPLVSPNIHAPIHSIHTTLLQIPHIYITSLNKSKNCIFMPFICPCSGFSHTDLLESYFQTQARESCIKPNTLKKVVSFLSQMCLICYHTLCFVRMHCH